MICDECETVAHCLKNGCVPKTNVQQEPFDPQDYIDPETGEPFNPVGQPAPLLDLDLSTGFTFFDREKGSSFIGEVEMLKWLVENRSKDYWEHKAKERSA